MSIRSAIAVLATATAASVGLSLAVRSMAQVEGEVATPANAGLEVEWAYRPNSLDELANEASAVVVAQVSDVSPGEPQALGETDSDADSPTVPSQIVGLEVKERISGSAPDSLDLFKLGGQGYHPEGSPAYRLGERYLLFIRKRLNNSSTGANPDGTWIAVAPDGRLRELPSGELDALLGGAVANELDGESLPEAIQEVESTDLAREGGQ